MYAGRIVEVGGTEDVLLRPAHPYTRGLLDAVPRLAHDGGPLQGIAGSVPDPRDPLPGCAFAPRCPRAGDVCRTREPGLGPHRAEDGERRVRCHFPLDGGN